MEQIQATSTAFAAILADGQVVTWGNPTSGGDNSGVQDQLKSVQELHATDTAFAAILADGTVVAWGNPEQGGSKTSAIRSDEKGLRRMWQKELI